MTFTIPGYNTLTIGDKYYLQSQQDISICVIRDDGKDRKFWYYKRLDRQERLMDQLKLVTLCKAGPREKVQDMQVGTRPYVYQESRSSYTNIT